MVALASLRSWAACRLRNCERARPNLSESHHVSFWDVKNWNKLGRCFDSQSAGSELARTNCRLLSQWNTTQPAVQTKGKAATGTIGCAWGQPHPLPAASPIHLCTSRPFGQLPQLVEATGAGTNRSHLCRSVLRFKPQEYMYEWNVCKFMYVSQCFYVSLCMHMYVYVCLCTYMWYIYGKCKWIYVPESVFIWSYIFDNVHVVANVYHFEQVINS